MAIEPSAQNGRPPKLTDADTERVKQALDDAKGVVQVAAAALLVHRSTLHGFIRDREDVQKWLHEVREASIDRAEGKMWEAIEKGDGQMVRFYLETQARDRGYGRRSELTGAGGGPVQIIGSTAAAFEAALLGLSGAEREALRPLLEAMKPPDD